MPYKRKMTEDNHSQGPEPIKATSKARKQKEQLSLDDFRRFINFKYGSEGAFARKMSWNVATASRLLNGNWIPQKVEVINKIAAELGFETAIIADLFTRLRSRPDFQTAAEVENDVTTQEEQTS
jgi:hypothetical protein